ncbi:MAG: hypothetical protein ACXVCE_13965, partial [Bacteriovorax sp.]
MERAKEPLNSKLSSFLKRFRKFGFISIIVTVLISGLSLLGWYLNISRLKYVVPSSHPMHPKTGIGMLFCSLALLLLNSKK